MKHTLILFGCLVSTVCLQTESLTAGCCNGNKKHTIEKKFIHDHFSGCGCGGNGAAGGANHIPPAEDESSKN